ncbi:MAG: hypothetical protein BWK78_03030 [Thiotrichaceae bacterium IS1]|nr:MAG: hypothetical protein BWK78_03030 [Thiotrichaceae bacterium IS1]
MDETKYSLYALPHLAEIFEALRKGRHLCEEDGKLYQAMVQNLEDYKTLFFHLGFHLEVHHHDFVYFKGDHQLSELARRLSVFMFILIETLADNSEDISETLITRQFEITDLPHFKQERYRAYMKMAGVDTQENLSNLLQRMKELGFIRFISEQQTFRFRTPVYRFLDICLDILRDTSSEGQAISDAEPQIQEEET